MKTNFLFLMVAMFMTTNSFAQFSQRSRDSINQLNFQDHQEMLRQLGITSLRPGPSGNPQDTNAANTDESKATTYTSLPDPLLMKDGSTVTSEMQWEKRKAEIFEDFDREVYGRLPAQIPTVKWEVVSVRDTMDGEYPVKIKQLVGRVDNSAYPSVSVNIQLTIGTPLKAAKPVPVIMEFGFIWPASMQRRFQPQGGGLSWQQQLLAKGWGYAVIVPGSVQADNGAGLRQGIIGLVNKGQPRKPDDWGALRAWAWGAGRALDYMETDKDIDAKRVGIEGLSRYGKATIVAMAYEPRFTIAFVGSSGAGGAKLFRRNFGEQVENLAASGEYHWFAGNFIKYAGPLTKNDLPVDAHQLVALCAPRPVFISAGAGNVEGGWVDAKGMFLGGVYAGPVYKLLGKKDLGTAEFPPQETCLCDGEIAWRQHEGGHATGPNWPWFIQFAERYFKY